jgi:hypothetical protein
LKLKTWARIFGVLFFGICQQHSNEMFCFRRDSFFGEN